MCECHTGIAQMFNMYADGALHDESWNFLIQEINGKQTIVGEQCPTIDCETRTYESLIIATYDKTDEMCTAYERYKIAYPETPSLRSLIVGYHFEIFDCFDEDNSITFDETLSCSHIDTLDIDGIIDGSVVIDGLEDYPAIGPEQLAFLHIARKLYSYKKGSLCDGLEHPTAFCVLKAINTNTNSFTNLMKSTDEVDERFFEEIDEDTGAYIFEEHDNKTEALNGKRLAKKYTSIIRSTYSISEVVGYIIQTLKRYSGCLISIYLLNATPRIIEFIEKNRSRDKRFRRLERKVFRKVIECCYTQINDLMYRSSDEIVNLAFSRTKRVQ